MFLADGPRASGLERPVGTGRVSPLVAGFEIRSGRISLGNLIGYACFIGVAATLCVGVRGVPMTDRAEGLRREAARYLAMANTTIDLRAREEPRGVGDGEALRVFDDRPRRREATRGVLTGCAQRSRP
jgi:hypothetical protein